MYRLKNYLTTGQAAEIFCVDPDTVLRWIKSGQIPAIRTPGGHYRIPRKVFLNILIEDKLPEVKKHTRLPVPYCWEFYSESGQIQAECRSCVVYQSKAMRCYNLSKVPAPIGHARLFCENTCRNCSYFNQFAHVTGLD